MNLPDVFPKPTATRQAWLDQLGKKLVGYFPASQILEILSDYGMRLQEAWDRTRSEADVLRAMDAPEEAAAQLLEEEHTAQAARLRHYVLWGAALVLCWGGLWVCLRAYSPVLFWTGSCAFLPLAGSALFLLLHGPARVEIEGRFPPEATASPVPVYCVPFALTAAYEAIEQILVAAAQRGWLPSVLGAITLGELNTYFIFALELVLVLLAVWLLRRSVTVSIRYFPGILHTVGAGGSLFYSYLFFTSTNTELPWSIPLALLLRLLPYCAGLASALAFQRWVDGRAPLPHCFQAAALTRQDWLHRLSQCLLGWFSAGQVLEVLEDYQEQFELGMERGKTEAELIADMGRPETVVRDLLREDRRSRLYRRKTLRWVAPLAVSVWLLLGILRTYEFGSPRLIYWYPVQTGVIALLLGAVSLFVLLHGQGRGMLEKQFPAERRPTPWLFLTPLAVSALAVGGGVCLIRNLLFFYDALNRPAGVYIVDFIAFSVLLLSLLLTWCLARCFSGSIWYLPAAVHAAGSMAHVLCAGTFFQGIDLDYVLYDSAEAIGQFFFYLLPYLTGLLLALVFCQLIRQAGRNGG